MLNCSTIKIPLDEMKLSVISYQKMERHVMAFLAGLRFSLWCITCDVDLDLRLKRFSELYPTRT